LNDCSTIIFRVGLLGLSHPEDTDTTVLKVWNYSPMSEHHITEDLYLHVTATLS